MRSLGAAAMASFAIVFAVACADDDDVTPTPSPTPTAAQTVTPEPGSTLDVLTSVGQSLPKFADFVVDQEYVYTGGELTDSIYWSNASVREVIHFYYEQMPPLRWDIIFGPSTTTASTSDKDGGGETSTITFSRGGFTVTVTATDDPEKDASRGVTRVGIRVERTDPAATVPPSIPTPTSEGF
jgi:hypothetical protein